MQKKWWYIIAGAIVVIGVVLAIIFWPKEDKPTATASAPEELSAEFLQIDPAYADSLIATLSLSEKINGIIIHELLDTSTIDTSAKYAGHMHSYLDFERLAELHNDSVELKGINGISLNSCLGNYKDSSFQQIASHSSKLELDSMRSLITKIKNYYGINFIDLGIHQMSNDLQNYYLNDFVLPLTDSLLKDSALLCVEISSPYDSASIQLLQNQLKPLVNAGINTLRPHRQNQLSDSLLKALKFKGLMIYHADSHNISNLLNFGTDAIISNNPSYVRQEINKLLERGEVSENLLDQRLKRVIMARQWAKSIRYGYHNHITAKYFRLKTQSFANHLVRNAICVVKNKQNVLPFKEEHDKINLVRIGDRVPKLSAGVSHYTQAVYYSANDVSSHTKLAWSKLVGKPVIIALNDDSFNPKVDTAFIRKVTDLDAQTNLVLAYLGHDSIANYFPELETIIKLNVGSDYEWDMLGQLLYGGVSNSGSIAENKISKTRLGYTKPIDVGLDIDSLYAISWIAIEGINNRAFPGCQVWAVKDGMVVYDGAFGHSSYKKQVAVDNNHIYDLASVTKVAATTVAAMMLYDKEKFALQDSLYKYIPDTIYQHLFRRRSTLDHITWQQLLTHNSGLPEGIPYIKYYDYRTDSIGRFDKYYCDWKDDTLFHVPVAENFYMERCYQDSIWITLNQMWLRDDKDYKYSDANFVLLYQLIRNILHNSPELVKQDRNEEDIDYNAFDKFLQEQVYRPLNMDRTAYLPRRYFNKEEIAPTEDDKFWRKQLVHGYVHDPTAALLGGISGNAGLFSTAHDMSKLFYMIMNGGYYGATRFISNETVQRFISRQNNSHRGLGYNKPVGGGMYGIPEEVSVKTFGHTGFTGNSIWADPENHILYIFLSNRSHPDAHNPKIIRLGTRKRIHRAVYSARVSDDWLIEPEPLIADTLSLDKELES